MASSIGNYQLGETIGRGAFGTVYKALNITTGDFYAIKQVALQNIAKDQISGIETEIGLLSRLKHPNIVKYVGHQRSKDHLFIVLEYVEGGSLQGILKKYGKFPEPLAAVYAVQILEGLRYLHEQGVIHRDIKAANILTTKDGTVKLADFGVATKINETSKTGASDVAGSPYWMAPEIIELSGPSPASDIWSVGCTVIELLTGQPPYFNLAPMPALFHIVQDDHPPLPDGVSPMLEDLLLVCFQKELELRGTAKGLLKHPWIKHHVKNTKGPKKSMQDVVKEVMESSRKSTNRMSVNLGSVSPSSGAGLPRTKSFSSERMKPRVVQSTGNELDDIGDLVSAPRSSTRMYSASVTGPRESARQSMRSQVSNRSQAAAQQSQQRQRSPDQPQRSESSRRMSTWRSQKDMSRYKDDDDDSYDDFFEAEDKRVGLKPSETLRSKMSQQWDGDAVDTDDIFADVLDDTFDEDAFEQMESSAQQAAEIMQLIGKLEPDGEQATVLSSCEQLVVLFREHPEQRGHLIRHHGVIPIMEMLQVSQVPQIIHAILRVVNQIIVDNQTIQESLCLLGGIPAIMEFANPKYAQPIRQQAALFVNQMCHTSRLTLQMFIACRGLPILVDLLEPNYEENKQMMFVAIDGITAVVNLQSNTPKNDFCRLFAKSKLLPRLANWVYQCNEDRAVDASDYVDKGIALLLVFSNADSVVKAQLAMPEVLSVIFRILDRLKQNKQTKVAVPRQVKILKALKLISMDPVTLDNLQQAQAIPKLISFLEQRNGFMVTEVHNQALSCMFNLCRINKTRQEQAAVQGVVPHLRYFAETNSPLKQFALPILCEMAHASRRTRFELWKHSGVELYLDLLTKEYWQVNALEALAVWLADEPRKVEAILQIPKHTDKFLALFRSAQASSFLKLLEPLQKMLKVSVTFNQALGESRFVDLLIGKFEHPQALVRVNLVRILSQVYECHKKPKHFIARHDLYTVLQQLKVRDRDTVLVQEIANQLLAAFEANVAV